MDIPGCFSYSLLCGALWSLVSIEVVVQMVLHDILNSCLKMKCREPKTFIHDCDIFRMVSNVTILKKKYYCLLFTWILTNSSRTLVSGSGGNLQCGCFYRGRWEKKIAVVVVFNIFYVILWWSFIFHNTVL